MTDNNGLTNSAGTTATITANQPPIANPGGPYPSVTVGTAVNFNGSGSTDPDGTIASYSWNFDDGTPNGTTANVSHSFAAARTYNVALTVTDNGGLTNTKTVAVTVTEAPAALNPIDAQLDPFNAVGGGGENPISRNFNWSANLVSLPGRAGMNAGVGLSYNSLVWLKQDNSIIFDPDKGFPSPGFRMGMPVVRKKTFSASRSKNVYLMITSSGSRIEFRQIGSTGIYETADSSYAQLQDNGTNLIVRTTDGSQQKYQLYGDEYKCTEVKDNNGNYITFAYDTAGKLMQITDTLGRQIKVSYQNGNPYQIYQLIRGVPRVYATLEYAPLQITTNFSGLTTVGAATGASVTVLSKVAFDDGSSVRFDYNSYGQVYQINNHAADNHKLNHVKYNLDAPAAGQTDCPRFTAREDWAENWTTATTTFAPPVDKTWTPPGASAAETGAMSKIILPDATEQHLYYHKTGWNRGIPVYTETWAAGARQRWTQTGLTQDQTTGINYPENPRVTESAIGDAANTRKTSVAYEATIVLPNSGTTAKLPSDVAEYNADGTVYRHAATDYEFGSAYTSRYIIGLVKEQRLYAGSGTSDLQSRVSFAYDQETLTALSATSSSATAVQHDANNYGATMTARGLLTSVTRHRTATDSTPAAVTSKTGYNITGNIVWTQTPTQTAANRVGIAYADSFADSTNRSTFAYPTTVTDPAGYTATARYDYFSGLATETQGAQAGQTSNAVRGVITQTTYDAADRVTRVEVFKPDSRGEAGETTGIYRRFVYPDAQNYVQTFSTVTAGAGEAETQTYLDGAGRTIKTRSENPGSTGGWTGQQIQYDNMSRAWRQSVPTEVDGSWTPAGDDQTRGWLWTTQTFDWKSRPRIATNTDGTRTEISYEGCGCAGGEITTIKGEQLAEGRRTQKIHSDVFGRQYKTEVLNWNGTVYTTTIQRFNARNQIEWTKQYATGKAPQLTGTLPPADLSCPTGDCQETAMSYDGHGRLKTRHVPQQDAGKSTTYEYHADDRIKTATDARGAAATYTYDERGLVRRIDRTMATNPQARSSYCQSTNGGCAGGGSNLTSGSSSAGNQPIGFLDGVDALNRKAWGWSLDKDNSSQSNTVHFYIDAPAGQGGVLIGSTTADKPRPDINTGLGYAGNHGFEFQIPEQYIDNKQHKIYAYGIDLTGESPKQLSG